MTPFRLVRLPFTAAGDLHWDPNANLAPDPETAQWVASGDGRWWLRYATEATLQVSVLCAVA